MAARESRSTAAGRVLDAAARYRRQKKQLEALEQDNFHEEPHADLGNVFICAISVLATSNKIFVNFFSHEQKSSKVSRNTRDEINRWTKEKKETGRGVLQNKVIVLIIRANYKCFFFGLFNIVVCLFVLLQVSKTAQPTGRRRALGQSRRTQLYISSSPALQIPTAFFL